MLYWILVTPAVLATARRTEPTALPVDVAADEELSTQKVAANVSVKAATEVCFEVQKSFSYSSLGETSGDRLQRGDNECVQIEQQNNPTKFALNSLAVGDLVRLSLSHVRVTRSVERSDGIRVKESDLKRLVTVLKMGAEIGRKVKTIQRVLATYEGSTKSEGAHLLEATGVEGSVGGFACFKVKTEMTYANVAVIDNTDEKLHKNETFCIHFDNQESSTLATIRTFAVEQEITIIVASETVEFEWRNGGTTSREVEWDFKIDLKKGVQKNIELSTENVAVTFEGTETVSTSVGDYAMRFCFKTDGDQRRVCFLNNLQSVAAQTKLVGFTGGERRKLGWRKCMVTFTDEETPATEENVISSIFHLE